MQEGLGQVEEVEALELLESSEAFEVLGGFRVLLGKVGLEVFFEDGELG